MRPKFFLALILALQVSLLTFAQTADDSTPSLGEVARKNQSVRKSKDPIDKPKVAVSDDDDSALHKVPIPSIALAGSDNLEEILNAIHDYRSKHTAAETEEMVHRWFDEQTQVLSAAIDNAARLRNHNQMKMENAQDHPSYPYNRNPDFDPNKYNEYLTGQRFSQRVDNRSAQENSAIIFRIQQAFIRVRADVICRPNKTQPAAYDWFRIRTGNGISSY